MVENFQDLLTQLANKMNEYNKDGEIAKASEIQRLGQYLYSNASNINQNIINSPAILNHIRLSIEKYVAAYKTVDDKFNISIQSGGKIEITQTGSVFKNTIDGRKTMETSVITYDQLEENPKYVSITQMEASSYDGLTQDASEYDKSNNKSESDISYYKSVFTQEGIEIQQTAAHTVRKHSYSFKESNLIQRAMIEFKPLYTIWAGYCPELNSRTQYYDKMACATRGKYLGDEENIGFYKLAQYTQTNNYSVEATYSIEPINFDARGPYLDREHQSEGIYLTATPEKSSEEIEADAIKKYGGEKAWGSLLASSEHHDISKKLLDYASNKIRNRTQGQYTIGKGDFQRIAYTQRPEGVHTQEAHFQNASNPVRDANDQNQI